MSNNNTLMDVGQCHYRYDDIGGRMPIHDTTPAEVAVLRETFKGIAQGDPISLLAKTGTIRRTPQAEIERLRTKYAENTVIQGKNEIPICDVLFSGPFAKIPMTFAELEGREVDVSYSTGITRYTPSYGDISDTPIERLTPPDGGKPVDAQLVMPEVIQKTETFPPSRKETPING
jgi:hypothetical protein